MLCLQRVVWVAGLVACAACNEHDAVRPAADGGDLPVAGSGGTGVAGSGTAGAGTAGGGAGGGAGMLSCNGGSLSAPAADPSLIAATPPMGWNSWNKLGGNVKEDDIKAMADAMVSSGMKDLGYQYVVIDDTWSVKASTVDGGSPDGRDASGKLQADPVRFPSGIKALADYVHGLGLKLGIYGDRGTLTCAGYPGSYLHETTDAQTFADWGVDYLKYDNCSTTQNDTDGHTMEQDYRAMGDALKATGRPVLYSICAWWFYDWMPQVGQIWRTTTDIQANWSANEHSIISLISKNGETTQRFGSFDLNVPTSAAYDAPGIGQYAGPGHWNDPDMLEVGNSGNPPLADAEQRAHFALWAMMAAPLIAGNDLRTMNAATKDILTNAEIIAVDQDPLGKQGAPLAGADKVLEIWSKPLVGVNTFAVALFNRGDTAADITLNLADLGLPSGHLRDLSSHADLGCFAGSYTSKSVPSHGVTILKLTGDCCTPG